MVNGTIDYVVASKDSFNFPEKIHYLWYLIKYYLLLLYYNIKYLFNNYGSVIFSLVVLVLFAYILYKIAEISVVYQHTRDLDIQNYHNEFVHDPNIIPFNSL